MPSPEVQQKAAAIRLLILDVDGVMTDGSIILQGSEERIKTFHVQDGLGVKLLQHCGISVAIITGKSSDMVSARAQALGIKTVYQCQPNKREAYHALLQQFSLSHKAICYMGDDLLDLYGIQRAGLGIAVSNAQPAVKECADWVTTLNGGQGAVREVCNLILAAQGKLAALEQAYVEQGGY